MKKVKLNMSKKFFHKRKAAKKNKYFSLERQHIIVYYCLLNFFKILGLAPLKVNFSKIFKNIKNIKNNHVYPYEVSKCAFLYNSFLVFALCVYIILFFVYDLWFDDYNNSIASFFFDRSVTLFGVIVSIFIWLDYIVHKSAIVDIVNELYTIDNYLKNTCNFHVLAKNHYLYSVFIGNFIINGCIIFVQIIFYPPISMLVWAVPCAISSWVLIQYSLVIFIIFQRCKCVNKTILRISDISTQFETIALSITKIPICKSVIVDITNIQYINIKVCKLCGKVVDFYAFPVLIAVVYFMTVAVVNLYYTTVSLNLINYREVSLLPYIDCGLTSVMTIFNFVILTTNVTKITREVLFTRFIILNYF